MPYAKCFITLCFNKQHKQLPRLAPDYCIEWRVQQASKQGRVRAVTGGRGVARRECLSLGTGDLLVLPCAPFNWACIELQAASSRTSSIFSCHLLHYVYAPMAARSYYPFSPFASPNYAAAGAYTYCVIADASCAFSLPHVATQKRRTPCGGSGVPQLRQAGPQMG